MIKLLSLMKELLGTIDKNDKTPKALRLPKGTIQGAFRTDETHPASRYPLRKDKCKK